MPLDPAFIDKLLKDELAGRHRTSTPTAPEKVRRFVVPEQFGPLRWIDIPGNCACRGCTSQTYCKVNGIYRCMMHALQELNEMLSEKEVDILL